MVLIEKQAYRSSNLSSFRTTSFPGKVNIARSSMVCNGSTEKMLAAATRVARMLNISKSSKIYWPERIRDGITQLFSQ